MAKKRGGLGRGLESLFEDVSPSFESDNKVETLPLREIEPDPGQPRKTFDDETLAELSASIAEHGLLQPIAVRPKPSGGYLIVAGERRWRASRMAGLTEVPVDQQGSARYRKRVGAAMVARAFADAVEDAARGEAHV